MTTPFDISLAREFATAILIGALVGVDREKRREGGDPSIGGIRTFVLIALTGASAGHLARILDAPAVFVAALALGGLTVLTGYVLAARARPGALGLTTEFAAMAVFLLGGLCVLGDLAMAVALGITVSAVLAFKQPIHAVVQKVGTDDLYAGLKLLIATFIILPVLPQKVLDPWGAINPAKLWLLVILISAMSLVGYLATRWLGAERGTVLTGITGGLVSSTAVTLALARRSREVPAGNESPAALATGILTAWLVMVIRIEVLLFLVNPALAQHCLLAMLVLAAATAAAAFWAFLKAQQSRPGTAPAVELTLKNPFSLTSAIKFAALFALVLVVVKAAQFYSPGGGVYFVAALAGTTDVDAISLSMADLARQGGEMTVASRAIVIAAVSNTIVKTGMVVALGSHPLRRPMLLAGAVITVAGIAAWFLG